MAIWSMVFPGQGSQSVGMLADLAAAFPRVRDTFVEASEALGMDLWRLTQEGPKEELDRTWNTQPAMLAAGVAVWRVWRDQGGPSPSALAGHSLGEYSALVAAEAMDFADAVPLVAARGRFMQEAVPESEGAMVAVLGLGDAQVEALCAEASAGEVLEPVNYNAPGQVVVAGTRAAVERMMPLAKAAGARRVLPLPVSVPSHCSLMRPAAGRLAGRLAEVEIRSPEIPVLHNASVDMATEPTVIRDLLVRQLYRPVRWVETIRRLAEGGATRILEAGPGKVLVGLNKRIDKGMQALPLFDPATLEKALEAIDESE